MRIIIDTREQRPWSFEGQLGITTGRAKLASGDYSVAGLEERVAIERKSLDDWIGTVTRDRARFYRELERLRAFEFRCVIIESSIGEIHGEHIAARMSPASIVGFIAEVTVDQCVPVLLGGSRAESQILAAALLRRAARKLQGSVLRAEGERG